MSLESGSTLRRVVEDAARASRVPGIVVAVARGARPVDLIVVGTDDAGRPLTEDTIFPVASVTKLATALTVLRLVDDGALSVDDPVERHLPDAAIAGAGITVRHLLSHTSGLPRDIAAHAVEHAPGLDWPALARACLATPLQLAPNSRVLYGNVGYGLLAVVMERLTGQRFADALGDLVLAPLGIEGFLGAEPPRPPAVVTGVRGPRAGTELEPYNTPFWRGLALPWGGLLTTARGALALARVFAGTPPDFLLPETRAEAVRNQTGDLAGGFGEPIVWTPSPWGLGPELRDGKTPHWTPPYADPASFGHAGMSGCIAWADPVADVAWSILGARTAESGWLIRRGPAIGASILST
ncbi:MAG: beta-lactamase family protein [Chloroflexi bacterium]|nr:beta-lactamase family protein [Chloroflexota bacterium]